MANPPGITVEGIVGTVAMVAGAALSIMAAVPTAGVSLVALVPDMAVLADSVATEINDSVSKQVFSVFSLDDANADAVKAAYKQVDQNSSAVLVSRDPVCITLICLRRAS